MKDMLGRQGLAVRLSEQRAHLRLPVKGPVVVDLGHDDTRHGRIVNLSYEDAFVAVAGAAAIAPGTILRLTLTGAAAAAEIPAVVIRTTAEGIAVAFGGYGTAAEQALRSLFDAFFTDSRTTAGPAPLNPAPEIS